MGKMIVTDLDLPPIARTQANLWKAKFFEMVEEVRRANKGIRRLKHRLSKLQERDAQLLAKNCVELLYDECKCDISYTSRGKTDPHCEYCDIGQHIIPLARKILKGT